MRDIVYILVMVGFFPLAALFVRACIAIVGTEAEEARAMSLDNVIGLILAIVALGYLVFALLYPEQLG